MPSAATPSASASAVASSGATGAGASSRRSAPSRRWRLRRKARAAASNAKLVAKLDVRGEPGFDLALLDRCGEKDARRGGTSGDLGDGEKGGSGQGIGRIERGGAAIGEKVFALSAARLGDAFGIGEREQKARRRRLAKTVVTLGSSRFASEVTQSRFRGPRPAGGKRPHGRGPLRAVAREMLEPLGEIGRGTAEPALDDEGRDFGPGLGGPETRRLEHHAREARRQGQGADGAPAIGEAMLGVERVEIDEELARLRERGARRRIEELEPRRIARRPRRRNRAGGPRDRR